jgi:hypothetical protein
VFSDTKRVVSEDPADIDPLHTRALIDGGWTAFEGLDLEPLQSPSTYRHTAHGVQKQELARTESAAIRESASDAPSIPSGVGGGGTVVWGPGGGGGGRAHTLSAAASISRGEVPAVIATARGEQQRLGAAQPRPVPHPHSRTVRIETKGRAALPPRRRIATTSMMPGRPLPQHTIGGGGKHPAVAAAAAAVPRPGSRPSRVPPVIPAPVRRPGGVHKKKRRVVKRDPNRPSPKP